MGDRCAAAADGGGDAVAARGRERATPKPAELWSSATTVERARHSLWGYAQRATP